MRAADERIHRYVRPCHSAQPVHLTEIADAQLHHRGLRLRAYAEERQRDAQLVVEVLFRLERAELPAQDAGYHLLGRGLAGAARYAHHRDLYRAAAGGGQLRHRPGHVRHSYDRTRDALRHPLRQAAGRAGFKRRADEVVAVHACAGQGAEHQARRYLAVIPDRAQHLALASASVQRPARVFRDLRHRHANHAYFSIEESIILWHSSG